MPQNPTHLCIRQRPFRLKIHKFVRVAKVKPHHSPRIFVIQQVCLHNYSIINRKSSIVNHQSSKMFPEPAEVFPEHAEGHRTAVVPALPALAAPSPPPGVPQAAAGWRRLRILSLCNKPKFP
jgi:hypothetical protein